MEILYSARSSAEYVAIESELDALRILRNDSAVADAAMGAVGELAARSDGYHRVPLTDALIAAAAAEHGGLAVMHDDLHFDRLSEVLAFDSVRLTGSLGATSGSQASWLGAGGALTRDRRAAAFRCWGADTADAGRPCATGSRRVAPSPQRSMWGREAAPQPRGP